MLVNSNRISPMRQGMLDFFDEQEARVQELAPSELEVELKSFMNYCLTLKITTCFTGCSSCKGFVFDEKLKTDFLAAIKTARACALSIPLDSASNVVNSITNSNHQEQSQTVNIKVIEEALRKSLTGEQYDEIMDLIKTKPDKKTLRSRLADFGQDVLAGIVSSVISASLLH